MKLNVFLDQVKVGLLTHDGETNRFSFDYDKSWVSQAHVVSLCPGLPLHQSHGLTPDAHSAIVRQFFENLLPEGRALDDAALAFGISKSSIVGLLIALGRETSGAISMRLVDAEPPAHGVRRPILFEEISDRIRQRPALPFTVWDGKVRLSIAGYQDKIALYEENKEWFLVDGVDLASTHILKPEPTNPRLAGLTSNEFFCMKLCDAIKLPVAPVQLFHVPEPVLLITRFDRSRNQHGISRLHAIDGCQLLGLSSSYKYERPYGDGVDVRNIRDGASYKSFFAAMPGAAVPAAQRLFLLRWAIFQVCIGNIDAHAKNLTFMVRPDGFSLAPAYDLVCGRLHDDANISGTYAMAIGDAFDHAEVSAFEWAKFCVVTKLNPGQVQKELASIPQSILNKIDETIDLAINAKADAEVVHRLAKIVKDECNRQIAMAPMIRKLGKH